MNKNTDTESSVKVITIDIKIEQKNAWALQAAQKFLSHHF
jgi:hypothetical protein